MRLNKNYLYVLLLSFTCFSVFAQEFDDGIEPPPTPIDDYLGVLGMLAVLFLTFIFYKKNFKLKQDDNSVI
jgi:hypothetical protein